MRNVSSFGFRVSGFAFAFCELAIDSCRSVADDKQESRRLNDLMTFSHKPETRN
jgi:hypothetical protein